MGSLNVAISNATRFLFFLLLTLNMPVHFPFTVSSLTGLTFHSPSYPVRHILLSSPLTVTPVLLVHLLSSSLPFVLFPSTLTLFFSATISLLLSLSPCLGMLRQTVAEEEALCKDGNKENKVKEFSADRGSHDEVFLSS